MQYLITALMLLATVTGLAQNGTASTEKKTFSRTTMVSQTIHAQPSTIWSLLTNAKDFPRWNSTIVSIDGETQKGEKIKLKSTLDTTRTFKLKIKELVPEQKLVWGDALGRRTFTLQQTPSGTLFTMTEKIGGPMFPLFANKIPSFDKSFEAFTLDLKNEAEKN
jgi:uncharacterized protein YndB with AHSA1/START domain